MEEGCGGLRTKRREAACQLGVEQRHVRSFSLTRGILWEHEPQAEPKRHVPCGRVRLEDCLHSKEEEGRKERVMPVAQRDRRCPSHQVRIEHEQKEVSKMLKDLDKEVPPKREAWRERREGEEGLVDVEEGKPIALVYLLTTLTFGDESCADPSKAAEEETRPHQRVLPILCRVWLAFAYASADVVAEVSLLTGAEGDEWWGKQDGVQTKEGSGGDGKTGDGRIARGGCPAGQERRGADEGGAAACQTGCQGERIESVNGRYSERMRVET